MTTNPSSLHKFLNETQKKPSRMLSQNFLIDKNIIHKFVSIANLSSDSVVLEIGPGSGAITRAILDTGACVIAVEKDKTLAKELPTQLPSSKLQVIEGDILDLDLDTILPKDKKIKVISNLPFKITSPIFGKFFPLHHKVETLTVIIQKDVAQRVQAKHNTKAFSSLTVFTHFYTNILKSFDISSNCYFPKPDVKTCAIQFELKKPPLENSASFFEIVRSSFKHRRKMISSSLDLPTQMVRDKLSALGLPALARPENLNLDNWLDFYSSLEEGLNA
ncbi:MAG: Ribosomal RNA small subunit methyltransferase A [Chlamydiae bacterium]|nr:Ribosomal RNA small subunit methyltransferase A [Chlamydiota bacterium]